MINPKPFIFAPFRIALAGLAVAALLAGCGPEERPVVVDLSKRKTLRIPQSEDAITYAYLPQYTHTRSYERHHRLVEFLRRETGRNVRQVFPDTFDQHVKMVGEGEADISFVNPFIYVQIAETYGGRAFARVLEPDGKPRFRGQIIARADNDRIRTLADCRGARWMAVDPGSAGGYLFGLGHFLANGIRRSDFREIAFAPGPGGKQEKVVMAVHSGAYDVGTIREGALDVVAGRVDREDIRVLDHTAGYPGWVYAARPGLSPEILSAIRSALLKLDLGNPDHRPILVAAGFAGVISAEDADFDPVRTLIRTISQSAKETPPSPENRHRNETAAP
ncbi:MAG: phosphate/phosphite/phosphonate ABC transporter substrate-binding protein [Desulfococcaceae bacterium]